LFAFGISRSQKKEKSPHRRQDASMFNKKNLLVVDVGAGLVDPSYAHTPN
jgi:hypothetical protein